jgi:hypothetical protein
MEQMAQPILAVAVVAERLITLPAFTQAVLEEAELLLLLTQIFTHR